MMAANEYYDRLCDTFCGAGKGWRKSGDELQRERSEFARNKPFRFIDGSCYWVHNRARGMFALVNFIEYNKPDADK